MTTRAKFICVSKDHDGGTITLQAVTSGSPENDSFFEYTPSGEITMGIVNEAVSEQFEVDKEYYVDFTPAG